MERIRRAGFPTVVAGLLLQLVGFNWDAVLHHLDPDLAAREGVFTLANPSHLLVMAGLVLAPAGAMVPRSLGLSTVPPVTPSRSPLGASDRAR